jgi:hypothetical protein
MTAEGLGVLGTKLALGQQAVGLSVIKKAAEADQQLASVIENTIKSVPVSSSRGSSFDISV